MSAAFEIPSHSWLRGLRLVSFSILLVHVCACGGEATPPVDDQFNNPLFSNAELIQTGTPLADCAVSGKPAFAWQSTGLRLVHAAVFRQNIAVRDGRITNPSDNVWAWHSGLGRGREGNVDYANGVNVENGELLAATSDPVALPPGTYVWAVWAWNDEGTKIIRSSREIFFRVVENGLRSCP